MAISLAAATGVTTATAARGTTSTTVAYVGVAAGRLAIITAGAKPDTAGINTPSGWTLLSTTSGGGAGSGADLGPTRCTKFYRILDGTETGNVTVTAGGSTSVQAVMDTYISGLGGWATPVSTTALDGGHGANYSAAGAAWSAATAVDDWVHVGISIDTDATGAISAANITQTGTTYGTRNARSRRGNSDGNDGTSYTFDAPVTAGGSTNAPTVTFTFASNSCGPAVLTRLREVAVASEVTLTPAVATWTPKPVSVETAPPWLNMEGGVAPRNGSLTRTIDFGFTPTAGSLLVCLVFGAVTHTESGADTWTEQLQPVSSGELSVFTTTDAATSITLTHNGSNYPVNWLVFEFPSGTTWTAGTSNNAANSTNQTWPALSGLPGTAQLVIAARAQAQSATGGNTINATWAAPWVEDYDQVEPFAVTDGAWMNVAHRLNVTGTSVTPTSTFDSSNVTNNLQQVVFAVQVPGGTPPSEVTATTATATWTAVPVSPAPGVSARTITPATMTATPVAVAPAPGQVARTIAPASAAWSPVPVTPTPQAVAVTLTAPSASWAAVAVSLVPTTSVAPATATWTAVAVTPAPGQVAVTLTPVARTITAVPVTVVAQVRPTAPTATWTAVTVTPVPQTVQRTLTPVVATWTALVPALQTPGAQTLVPVTSAWTAVPVTPVPGQVSRTASPASAAWTAVAVVPVRVVPASVVTAAWTARTVTLTIGQVARTITPAVVVWSAGDIVANLAGRPGTVRATVSRAGQADIVYERGRNTNSSAVPHGRITAEVRPAGSVSNVV